MMMSKGDYIFKIKKMFGIILEFIEPPSAGPQQSINNSFALNYVSHGSDET